MEYIAQFIDAMTASGCAPAATSDIIADDKRRRYVLSGDKPRDKKGTYQLKIEGDFAAGRWTNFKTGESHSWHSKTGRKWTDEEKEHHRARIKAQKAAQEAADIKAWSDAADKAKRLWAGYAREGTTPYLERKQAALNGARVRGDIVCVPAWRKSKISSIQFIQPDGTKRFLTGGRKDGAYFPIASPADDQSIVAIVEGFATGDAVRKATGYPVICAFDAGNLKAVAIDIHDKYPDARIIFCADDDQWTLAYKYREQCGNPDTAAMAGDDIRWNQWREKGFLINTGLKRAREAAAAIGGAYVVVPGFDAADAEKNTDFNDLFLAQGIDAVKNRILSVLHTSPQTVEAPDEHPPAASCLNEPSDLHLVGGDFIDQRQFEPANHLPTWQELAEWKQGARGEQVLHPDKSINYGILVEHLLAGIYAWDEFRLCVIVQRCPPWADASRFKVHELTDNDIIECDYWTQKRGMNGSESKTKAAIHKSAIQNAIHPARDYFNGLKWDGIKRLDNWLIDICGCEKDDHDYLRAVGSKWMIAAVKRVYEPGCQWDHMLLLEGKQASYKSSALRELATFGEGDLREEYFTDNFNLRDHKNKDEILKLWGCLIVEVGEMAGFRDSDIDSLKNFITVRSDKIRIPYSKLPQVFHRQFIFAGTRNPVGGMFKDPTGSRRFWPVSVGMIDMVQLRRDKKQLWAEAVERYRGGESLQLSNDLYLKCAAAASERSSVDIWEQDVLSKIEGKSFITVREIAQEIGIPIMNRAGKEQARIQDILKSNGYEYARIRVDGRQIYGWRKEITETVVHEEEIKF